MVDSRTGQKFTTAMSNPRSTRQNHEMAGRESGPLRVNLIRMSCSWVAVFWLKAGGPRRANAGCWYAPLVSNVATVMAGGPKRRNKFLGLAGQVDARPCSMGRILVGGHAAMRMTVFLSAESCRIFFAVRRHQSSFILHASVAQSDVCQRSSRLPLSVKRHLSAASHHSGQWSNICSVMETNGIPLHNRRFMTRLPMPQMPGSSTSCLKLLRPNPFSPLQSSR